MGSKTSSMGVLGLLQFQGTGGKTGLILDVEVVLYHQNLKGIWNSN